MFTYCTLNLEENIQPKAKVFIQLIHWEKIGNVKKSEAFFFH